MRAHRDLCSAAVYLTLAVGCTDDEPPPRRLPEVAAVELTPRTASVQRYGEPLRLPFSAAMGNDEPEYVFSATLLSGGSVTYHRWRGALDRPGPPVRWNRVRTARFADLGGSTPVYVTEAGDQHVFRRGPPASPYQASLVFSGSTDDEIDDLLSRTVVTTTHLVGPELPPPVDVCVGPLDALRRRRADPTFAGMHMRHHPVVGEYLNWHVEGAPCVTYPGLSITVPCEGEPLPWVAAQYCAR